MAQMNDNDKGQSSSSLADFSFDNEVEFFGIQPEGGSDAGASTVREVKSTSVTNLDDDVPADDSDFTFGDATTATKKKPTATTTKKKEDKTEVTTVDDEDKDDDEDEEDVDFFNTGKEDDDEIETTVNDEEVTAKEDKKGKEDKRKGKENAGDTDDVDSDEVKDEDEDAKFFRTLASEMKEKGVFQNIEIPTDQPLTEEKFFELQDEEIEARVEETFQAFGEELDDDGKRFLKFKQDGGNTQDFFNLIQSPINLDSFDESDPKQVEAAIQHYVASVEGLEGEELEDRIQWMKDGGKSKAYANKFVKKMKEDRDARVERLLTEQSQKAKLREESNKKFNNEFTNVLNSTEKVGTFPISKTDQKELTPYVTKPTVKVGKNKYVPQFQADLAQILKGETPEAKQKLAVLAKLVKSDFAVKDLAKEVTTRVTQKAKSKLRETRDNPSARSSRSSGGKSLTEYF